MTLKHLRIINNYTNKKSVYFKKSSWFFCAEGGTPYVVSLLKENFSSLTCVYTNPARREKCCYYTLCANFFREELEWTRQGETIFWGIWIRPASADFPPAGGVWKEMGRVSDWGFSENSPLIK